jgi:glyoxylase-like metal-dependent hydrolase (beta-lactamase superfamily II)
MLLQSFEAGPAATIGYLMADDAGGPAIAVDSPLGTADAMAAQARQWGRPIAFLLITHGHWDHVLDCAKLLKLSGAKFGIHQESAELLAFPQTRLFGLDLPMPDCRPDLLLAEGQTVEAGTLALQILECPGHCPGSVALYEAREGTVFAGDVLFAGTVGRTDLWGGNSDLLLASIRHKLLPLGDKIRVLPGHGPGTTIGRERERNPFLRAESSF